MGVDRPDARAPAARQGIARTAGPTAPIRAARPHRLTRTACSPSHRAAARRLVGRVPFDERYFLGVLGHVPRACPRPDRGPHSPKAQAIYALQEGVPGARPGDGPGPGAARNSAARSGCAPGWAREPRSPSAVTSSGEPVSPGGSRSALGRAGASPSTGQGRRGESVATVACHGLRCGCWRRHPEGPLSR